VHDALAVRGVEGGGHLLDDRARLVDAEPAPVAQSFRQALAVQELHGEERLRRAALGSCTPKSKIRHTLMWVTLRDRRISRLKRSVSATSVAKSARMVFSATEPPRTTSSAS